ncbi:MAG: translocation/assembly module TamB domain-containing protein [Caulobacteraceae bacterium]
MADTPEGAQDAAPARAPRPGRVIICGLIAVAVFAALAVVIRLGPLTPAGRQVVESEANGLKLGRLGRLEARGLKGDVWRDFSIERLAIADKDGVWLEARGVAVHWRWWELLSRRRVDIETLSAGQLTIFRRPILGPRQAPGPIPVSVAIDRAALRLTTAPAFSAVRGAYEVSGGLYLDRRGPARGSVLARSLLRAGDFLRARFDVAKASAFSITAEAREASGGAIAGMAGLAADQPFSLSARAFGAAGGGSFSLLARVGVTIPAAAHGSWTGSGGEAEGRIELTASSLLARYRTLVGPQLTFQVAGAKARDGLADLVLTARSANVALTARGEGDMTRLATGPKGVRVDLAALDVSPLVSWPRVGAARARFGLGGDARHWSIAGSATLERLATGVYALARISGPIRLEGRGGEVRFTLGASGEGGTGKGLAAALLGARPTAAADGRLLADGRLVIHALSIDGSGLKLEASGERGLFGGLGLQGQASVANLAFAHPGAKGVVRASWKASEAGQGKPWSFAFDAKASGFAAGFKEADRLLGPVPRLRAQGEYRDGGIALSTATLDGAGGDLAGSGLIGRDGALAVKLDWRASGPFTVGPITASGALKGGGALTGTLAAPRAELAADVDSIDLPDLPLQKAHLVLALAAAAGGSEGRISLAGASPYGPARAASAFRLADDGFDLTALDLDAGGVIAKGAVAVRTRGDSTADLALTVGPGAFLTAGRATGTVSLVHAPGGSRAAADITASGAVLRGTAVSIGTARITAAGPLSRLAYQVSAQGRAPDKPWRLAGSGVFAAGAAKEVLSFSGTSRVGWTELRTLSPLELTWSGETMSARVALGAGRGRVDLVLARNGQALDAQAKLSNLGLELVNSDFVGRLDGVLSLKGAGSNLTGDLAARLSGAGARELKESPLLDGQVRAHLAGHALSIASSLTDSKGLKATGELILPAEASATPFRIAVNRKAPMSGHFSLDGEIGPLWNLLMGADRSLTGHAVAAGALSGSLADPGANGVASLDDGRFDDAQTGLKMDHVSLRATLADKAVDVGRFSATDGAAGSVTGSGEVSLYREGASSFRLRLTDFRLIDNDTAKAAASGEATVNRAADGRVRLVGDLTIDRALISANPPTPTGVVPMEVVEIHRDEDQQQGYRPARPNASPVAIDVAFKAARGVFVKGRGLNVELSLDAHVGGSTAEPVLAGTSRIVRGDYDFAGKRFQFDERGVVYLGATAETIRLDLTATREDPSLTAVIKISGTAAKPKITLTSTPVLPADEVLSQVLFGASAAKLPPLEAAQLASALSGLAGGGGLDVMSGLRNFAHLDRLAFGGSATAGSTISGGKYLRDNVYIELTQGTREGPSAQVEWRARKHLSIVSRLGGQGDSQLSVRWRRDF